MKRKELDMQGVSVFTPQYLQPVRKDQCRADVHDEGRSVGFHQCGRTKNLLEYGGMRFCKHHHPPSIKAREAKARKCEYVRFGTPHGVRLKRHELGVMCAECCHSHVKRVNEAKVDAYDRLADKIGRLRKRAHFADSWNITVGDLSAMIRLRGVPRLPLAAKAPPTTSAR